MHRRRAAVGTTRGQRGGHGRRRVDDDEVTRLENLRQIMKPAISQAAGRDHEEADVVTSDAALLRWQRRLEPLGHNEPRPRARHAGMRRDHGETLAAESSPTR